MKPHTQNGDIRLNQPTWTPPEFRHCKIVMARTLENGVIGQFAVRWTQTQKLTKGDKETMGIQNDLENLGYAEAHILGKAVEKWMTKNEKKAK